MSRSRRGDIRAQTRRWTRATRARSSRGREEGGLDWAGPSERFALVLSDVGVGGRSGVLARTPCYPVPYAGCLVGT